MGGDGSRRTIRERGFMIDIDLARRLKHAGLEWWPTERDFFAIPDHQLEGQVFVVGQLPALVQMFSGQPTITFHGSIEWALDYILLTEALWLPTETQLREQLARAIGERSEEHTSELQSRRDLVCRLLLEKKKKTRDTSRRH